MSNTKKRVLSGIQPTSQVHLGNYLGALKRWVSEQDNKENYFCIVDLHAITVYQDPAALNRSSRELLAVYLAAGLDPKRCTIFLQSHVHQHTEAAWLLNCVTPLGWLNKMTQFKDKSQKKESVAAGLFTYPVLMAADILLYQPDEVPVGEDQKQHVELARNIAERFNHLYGQTFKVPEPTIPQVAARVMGLDDPTKKMSKSSGAAGHAVFLADSPDVILKAFQRCVTDSGKEICFSDAPEKAGVNNLLSIYQAITGLSQAAIEQDFATARGYGDLKKKVAEVVIAELAPIREKFTEYMQDQAELLRMFKQGAEAASVLAEKTVTDIKEKMGFVLLAR